MGRLSWFPVSCRVRVKYSSSRRIVCLMRGTLVWWVS